MVECCIKIALGETPDIKAKYNKGSAIRYFHQHAGVVTEIEGISIAEAILGVQQVSIVHGVGETITEIDSSTARMGFVIAQGNDADDAERICESARNTICCVVE